MNVTVGSDVEFFVARADGTIVSAEGYVEGTKREPFRFDPREPHYATQLDNVLAEGNIPPASTVERFVMSLKTLRTYLDTVLEPSGLHTVAQASAHLTPDQLMSDNAKNIGCDPSFDCWTLEMQPVSLDTVPSLRSAGFHIHVGYDEPNLMMNLRIVRAMDLFLGVPATLVEPENDRKKVGYGASGNFRHQAHGVEYRTLSSFFASSETLMGWAFRGAIRAMEWASQGYEDSFGVEVRRAINSNDKKALESLVQVYGMEVPTWA